MTFICISQLCMLCVQCSSRMITSTTHDMYPITLRTCVIHIRDGKNCHLRAQYVEATLQRTEMSSDEMSSHKDLRPAQMQNTEPDVKRVIEVISGFCFTSCFCFTSVLWC